MFDWGDLRFVLAVARAGSALGAARALKVNQTTVTRRIAQLEEDLGAELFETRQSGQTLTPLGELVAASAEKFEAEVHALQSLVDARLRSVSGAVRFTSPDVYADLIVGPFLRGFRQQFPEITVEVMADDRQLDIAKGEADVAVRANARPEGGGIVGQRLPDVAWAPYCSRGYANDHGLPSSVADLNRHAVILVDNRVSRALQFRWLPEVAHDAKVSARSNSLTNSLSAVRAGLGIGMLPCFVGDTEADLVRCLPPSRELDNEVWMIVREDIRSAPHVRAFVDALSAHLATLRQVLMGRETSPSAPKTAR